MKRLSGRWKHLIVCPDRGLFNSLTAILSELTPGSVVTDLKAYPARRTLSDLLEKEEPNLCFLDVGSSWDSARGPSGMPSKHTAAPAALPVQRFLPWRRPLK